MHLRTVLNSLARTSFSILLFSLVLAGISPLPVSAQHPGGMQTGGLIDVQVRFADGRPAPRGIHIRLESAEGGAEGDAETVEGGKCQLHTISSGVFIVRLNGQGYQDVSERVELVHTSQAFVTLTLKRLSGAEEPGGEPPAPEAPGAVVSLNEVNIPEKARQEFAKAEAALREKQLDESEKHLHKALKIYDRYPQAYRMLGEIYLERQEWPKAETSLHRSIALDPDTPAAYIDLGALYNQQKQYPKAEEALKKGLTLGADSPLVQYELAKTYWALNRWQDAAPLAKATVAALPDLAPAHALYGNILLKQRDPSGALKEYKEYLRLEPRGTMAAQVRDLVGKLEKALHN